MEKKENGLCLTFENDAHKTSYKNAGYIVIIIYCELKFHLSRKGYTRFELWFEK